MSIYIHINRLFVYIYVRREKALLLSISTAMDRQRSICFRRCSCSCLLLTLLLLLLQQSSQLVVVSGLRMPAHTSNVPTLSSSSSSSSSSSLAFVASAGGSLHPRDVAGIRAAAPASPSSAAARHSAAATAETVSSLSSRRAALSPSLAAAADSSFAAPSSATAAARAATSAAAAQQLGEASAASSTEEIAPLARPASLAGKIAFVAGVGDSNGYGWAIARELAAAGAQVAVGTWPPVLSLFTKSLEAGKFDADRLLPDKSLLQFKKIYPLDAAFDTPQDVPQDIKENKRYAGIDGFTISEVAEKVKNDLGGIDILVHSLANGPEVANPLLKTSRKGYLAAVSNSSYSMVSLLQHFAPIMKKGGSAVTLSYIASEKVVPGYGGGMSSAKAALESDTRTLAWEAGQRFGVRVNTISAGPLRSRAAQAIGKDGERFIDYAVEYSLNNAPLRRHLQSDDVAAAALFLLSPMARAVTGVTLYVDNGLHAMGHAVDSRSLPQAQPQQATS